jgi:transposase-like protein
MRTVSEDVYERVQALSAGEPGLSRAEAIRRVARQLGRTPAATSSAYYAGARRAAGGASRGPAAPAAAPARPDAPARSSGHSDAGRLYARMLPLVEAGASVEQAARRFGSEDDVPAIAAGFERWRARQRGDAAPSGPPGGAAAAGSSRVVALEAEVRGLRRELARTHTALARIRAALESLEDD